MDRSDNLRLSISPSTDSAATAEQPSWDFIIVGAGSAGLPAAIFASRRGARVLLIAATAEVGGASPTAFGQVSAAGTRLQRSLGIEDSLDRHFEDLMRMTRGVVDQIVRLAVEQAPATVTGCSTPVLLRFPTIPSRRRPGAARL